MIGGAGMTSLAQSDSAGVCPVTNGPAPLSAAADLVVGGMCPPFSGIALLSVEHPVGAALLPVVLLQGQRRKAH